MITQSELKQKLDYNPETGIFTYKQVSKYSHRVKVGDVAGYLNDKGYLTIMMDGKRYTMHRLAHLYMTGSFPEESIDHINRVKTDNRWENLRPATSRQNAENLSCQSKHGVGVRKRGNSYSAYYTVKGKFTNIGSFPTVELAQKARTEAIENLAK